MMNRKLSTVIGAASALLLLGAVRPGQTGSPDDWKTMRRPTYVCYRTSGPITIDGRLDEPAWARTPAVTAFLRPDGLPAERPTEAKLLWDPQYLYVAFYSPDPDVWAYHTRRDEKVYEAEAVEVFLDPDGDQKNYYEFEVNAHNCVWDGWIRRGLKEYEPSTWNCAGLKTAVAVDGTLNRRDDEDRGWTAEWAIPFAALRERGVPPNDHTRWRINLCRIESAGPQPEFSSWAAPFSVYANFHATDRYGEITFRETEVTTRDEG
jgi:hypothetical protein